MSCLKAYRRWSYCNIFGILRGYFLKQLHQFTLLSVIYDDNYKSSPSSVTLAVICHPISVWCLLAIIVDVKSYSLWIWLNDFLYDLFGNLYPPLWAWLIGMPFCCWIVRHLHLHEISYKVYDLQIFIFFLCIVI